MLPRPIRRRLRLVGASTASILLALAAFAGMASAHTSKPATISANINGSQVSVQGSWTWQSQATATLQYKVGYAVDWGDVASGNAISTFHIGDGTGATNVVLTNVSPNSGASGAWGPATHTYKAAGTYNVCVIMYDVGPVLSTPAPSGQFSLIAGGTGHNPDNSVEELTSPATQCTQVKVAAATSTATSTGTTASPTATPTPEQSVLGATSVPSLPTLPPTSTATDPSSTGNSSGLSLLLLALSVLFGAVAFRAAAEAHTRR